MSDETVEQIEAVRVFATPNEHGVFFDDAGETLYCRLPGIAAMIRVVEQPDGWRAAADVSLPEAGFGNPIVLSLPAYPLRAQAITHAAEDLILWCGEQKEKGSRKHRRQADQIQSWALNIEKDLDAQPEMTTEEVIAAVYPGSLLPGIVPLHPGTTIGREPFAAAPQMYPLAELHESPLNPRKIVSDAALEAMAEDMRLHGFRAWSPIFARPRVEGGAVVGKGHRRRLAAIRAGLTHVPVVLVEMTDQQFLEILNFDNDGNEEVHPLHAAEGWQAYMQMTGETVLDIAARANISKEAVYKRLVCLKLIEAGRAIFLSGRVKEGHAAQIARLPRHFQERAVDFCTPPKWDPEQEVPTVAELAVWIRRNCHLSLIHAPFDPADATLMPLAGPCTTCPRRAGSNAELFGDLEPETCTDAECYHAKAAAAEPKLALTHPEPEPEKPAAAPTPAAAPRVEAPKPAKEPKRDTAAEERAGAEDEQRTREEREAEEKRIARENEAVEKTYAKAVNAILEKITWPLSQADLVDILAVLIDTFECTSELATKFAIPRGGGMVRHDIIRASVKFAPLKLVRMMFAGILLDAGIQDGEANNALLAGVARRYKVDLAKIRKQVDIEIDERLGLRKLNPPADPRKAAIAKLDTLAKPAPKKDAPKPAAKSAPVKKAVKKPAPAQKKKGGKK